MRICGDYKLTVNKASHLEQYPLPRMEDLFAKLAGGKLFTELDLSHAYEQLLLDEESQEFVTINTHRGLYRYLRLPYGVSSLPAIFQRTIETLLQDIPHVGGVTQQEHLQNLETVFDRLQQANLRLKRIKCQFMLPDITCLGHQINAEGFRPVEAKVQAMKAVSAPKDKTELKCIWEWSTSTGSIYQT